VHPPYVGPKHSSVTLCEKYFLQSITHIPVFAALGNGPLVHLTFECFANSCPYFPRFVTFVMRGRSGLYRLGTTYCWTREGSQSATTVVVVGVVVTIFRKMPKAFLIRNGL